MPRKTPLYRIRYTAGTNNPVEYLTVEFKMLASTIKVLLDNDKLITSVTVLR